MVFDKKFRLVVTTKEEKLFPGDILEAYILLKPEEKFQIIRLTASLENIHEIIWYSTRAHVMQYNASTITVSQKEKIPIVNVRKIMAENLEVIPGEEYKFSFKARIPSDAIPSFIGERIQTFYYIKVKVEIKWGIDREEIKEIIILQKPEKSEIIDYFAELDSLVLGTKIKNVLFSGEEVEGSLVVMSKKDKEYLGIRVDIVRVEDIVKHNQKVERKIFSKRIKENIKLQAGSKEKMSFSIKIPENQATFRTNVSATEYYVRIVFEKKYRLDKFIQIPIKILRTK